MARAEWSFEKQLVALCFAFIMFTVIGTGALMERTIAINKYGRNTYSFDSSLPVAYSAMSESSTAPTKIKADVKGSIYENGSNMTVFGACFDGSAYLLPEADAKFTAWYPNGTVMIGPNATMDRIYKDVDHPNGNSTNLPNGTGRWKIHVTMGDTIGTYLTEIRCSYQGEWAVAFGEWQNPEWVKRIGDTQGAVANLTTLSTAISSNLTLLQNQSNANYNNIVAQLAGLTFNGSIQSNYLEQTINDINLNRWVIDKHNPFYVLNSGTHNWAAVDMISENSVAAASSDGYVALWDGETWTENYNAANSYRAVSILPSNVVYAVVAGTNGANPIISINGANGTIPASITGTAINDIKLFQAPNDPSSVYHAVALSNDGSLWMSMDNMATWTQFANLGPASKGRVSQVVENWNSFAQVAGYLLMASQNDTVITYDDVTVTTYALPSGCVAKDSALLNKDVGYVVAKCALDTKVFKYTGNNLTLDYTIQDPGLVPSGIAVLTPNNVWITTLDPSTFYHFDGRKWAFSSIGWSQFVSVVINFGNSTTTGITDVSMPDSRHGYAVGSDGIILKYESEDGLRYDSTIDLLRAINQTTTQDLADINATLSNINASLDYKLDNIVNNVTYTQLYMETTLTPMINATYQNTLQILVDLGIISAQVNQTIVLQNATLNIVNQTQQDVAQLLNNSNRIRAWTTQ